MADVLLDRARAAIDKLHSDTSVSASKTLSRLRDLQEHIGVLIEGIEQDGVEADEA